MFTLCRNKEPVISECITKLLLLCIILHFTSHLRQEVVKESQQCLGTIGLKMSFVFMMKLSVKVNCQQECNAFLGFHLNFFPIHCTVGVTDY